MEAMFQKDIGNSHQITREEWAKRPAQDRAKELAARMWQYWLLEAVPGAARIGAHVLRKYASLAMTRALPALLFLAAASAGASDFTFDIETPNVRVTLPKVPAMKLEPHPMRAGRRTCGSWARKDPSTCPCSRRRRKRE